MNSRDSFLPALKYLFFLKDKELIDCPYHLKVGKVLILLWITNISIVCSNEAQPQIQESLSTPFQFNWLHIHFSGGGRGEQIGIEIDKKVQAS